jgi:glycosyltransferase involved in cell wall biosynthesis
MPAPVPTVVVATIMRRTGETGVQAHFRAVLEHLDRERVPAACVTPFDVSKYIVYPLFGMRRGLDPISGTASVWWYRHWHSLLLRKALNRRLRAITGPYVVYAQCPLSAWAALSARGQSRHPVVMAVHFNTSQALEWAEKGRISDGGQLYSSIVRFEERVLPVLDGIVYVSRFMRRELEARIPSLSQVRSTVIPNFVESVAETPRPSAGDLVCVGSLEPRKNQAYLLEILGRAAAMGRRYSLTIVGDGPDRPLLERRAVELGVEGQVRFLGFRQDARDIVGSFQLYCHTARRENLSIAILEAMAMGVPVAVVPVGGVPELVRDGVEGVFLPADDASEAARIIVDLMDDEPRRSTMAAACRRRVAEGFTATVAGPQLLEFLVQAANR